MSSSKITISGTTQNELTMTIISIEEIQRDLRGYLRRVAAGETLVVLESNKPLAEIKPIVSSPHEPRPFGLCAGEFVVPDDFDAPLPSDVLDLFEGQ
jgi:antitoxin (DNA-binding transcriptional repressor) of toxin-antitoxin stability system